MAFVSEHADFVRTSSCRHDVYDRNVSGGPGFRNPAAVRPRHGVSLQLLRRPGAAAVEPVVDERARDEQRGGAAAEEEGAGGSARRRGFRGRAVASCVSDHHRGAPVTRRAGPRSKYPRHRSQVRPQCLRRALRLFPSAAANSSAPSANRPTCPRAAADSPLQTPPRSFGVSALRRMRSAWLGCHPQGQECPA